MKNPTIHKFLIALCLAGCALSQNAVLGADIDQKVDDGGIGVVHTGKGDVSVYSRSVFLGENFEVGPGPDFHVYLVPRADIRSSSDVSDTMYVDLGRLRAFKGSQNYAIPAGVDLKKFPSVVIWCQQFSVLISPADLTFE